MEHLHQSQQTILNIFNKIFLNNFQVRFDLPSNMEVQSDCCSFLLENSMKIVKIVF